MEIEPFDSEDILADLQRENEARRKQTRALRVCVGFICTLSVGMAGVTALREHSFPVETLAPLLVFATGGIAAGASQKHKALIGKSAALSDKRALPFLLEVLDAGDADLAQIARDAVQALLPQLTPDDAVLLDAKQRALLFGQIRTGISADFVSAAVAALSKIGGRDAVAPLEFVAAGNQIYVEQNRREKLRGQAGMVLADVKIRIAREIVEQATGTVVTETADALLPSASVQTAATLSNAPQPQQTVGQRQG